jgi:membrane protease YdiL (CAAX protease family)
MKTKFAPLWLIWTILGALFVYVAVGSDSKNDIFTTIAMIVSLAPLMGIMLTMGSVKAFDQFKNWIDYDQNSQYYIAGVLSILFSIPGLLTGNFDPYHTIIFGFITLAVFGVMKQNRAEEFKFNWSDLAIWLLLWIPFDLRWYDGMQDHLDYTWWSQAISVVAIIGWYAYRGANIGFNLAPKFKDIIIAVSALFLILAAVIVPGIATDFLIFSIPETYDIPKLAVYFIGLFLTVALPEELFFRGILLRGLDRVFSKKWIPMVISSLAFGLMHWNNINDLSMQITYISLATIAGLGYGWAFRKSGNNLFAAILAHTLVDWVWKLFLHS